MMGNVLGKVRAFVIRGLAVGAIVLTYMFGGLVAQVATAVGVSTLALTTTATPAQARWRRRYYRRYRYVPRRRYYRRYYVPRRRYYRRWRRRW